MAHWHNFNPWATTLVYPADANELYLALSPGGKSSLSSSVRFARQRDVPFDIYLLAGGRHASCGVRYGKEPEDYISVFVDDEESQKNLLQLFDKYSGRAP